MRPVVVVVVQPGGDGDAQLLGAVPVAEPEQLLLEGADEALDDAVGAGVLRAVIGAQLDALGHVVGRAEGVDDAREGARREDEFAQKRSSTCANSTVYPK
jgi:hypothetical protein